MPFARGSPVTRFSAMAATYVEINLANLDLTFGDVGLDTQASAGPVPI